MSGTNGHANPFGTLWDGDPITKRRQLINNENFWRSRGDFLSMFDDPRRDINFECGYPDTTSWSADDYYALYEREPLATRVCQLMPKECWQVSPTIKDGKKANTQSQFEMAVENLGHDLAGGWHAASEGSAINEMLYRVDILSGIGSFGILLMGFDDGKPLEQPVEGMVDVGRQMLAQNLRTGQTMTMNEARAEMAEVARVQKWYVENRDKAKLRPPRQDRYRFIRKLTKNALLPDSPLHPNNQEELLNLKPIKRHDGWHKEGPNAGKEKTRDVPPKPLTDNERRIISKWQTEREAVIGNAAAKLAAGGELTLNEECVVNEGLVTEAMVTNARRRRPDVQVSQEEPTGVQEPRAEAVGMEEREILPGVKAMIDTRGNDVSGTGGTDFQYFAPGAGPDLPAAEGPRKERKLLFLRAFAENLVQVVRYEWNSRNPRFGMPVMYRVTLNDPREVHSGIGLPLATVFVHWTRIIHVPASDATSSVVFGVPEMRPVLNALLDCRKVKAAGAEAYWRNCVAKLFFETHPQLGGDVKMDHEAFASMMENMDSGFQRYGLLSGLSAKQVAPSMSDPTGIYTLLQQSICTQKGIPFRVWQGSEVGSLASQEDTWRWNDRLTHNCNIRETPKIVCPFYDRMIAVGVLPEPDEGYVAEWPDRNSESDADKANIAQTRTSSMNSYVNGDLESIMSLKDFWVKVHEYTEDEADEIISNCKKANEGGYDVDLNTLRSSGGPSAMVDLFERLQAGTLSEEAFKQILMLFYDRSEDEAQEIYDKLAKSIGSEDEDDVLSDAEASAVAFQKTQSIAAYEAGGVAKYISPEDYLEEFIGVDDPEGMLERAKEAKAEADEEAAKEAAAQGMLSGAPVPGQPPATGQKPGQAPQGGVNTPSGNPIIKPPAPVGSNKPLKGSQSAAMAGSAPLPNKPKSPMVGNGLVTHGDVPGHEFHGNQWTDGEGGDEDIPYADEEKTPIQQHEELVKGEYERLAPGLRRMLEKRDLKIKTMDSTDRTMAAGHSEHTNTIQMPRTVKAYGSTFTHSETTVRDSLRHEIGHAIDSATGGSSQKGFKDALAKDLKSLSPEDRKKFAYFVGATKEPIESAAKEVYAQASSVITGAGAEGAHKYDVKDWEKAFPNVTKTMREIYEINGWAAKQASAAKPVQVAAPKKAEPVVKPKVAKVTKAAKSGATKPRATKAKTTRNEEGGNAHDFGWDGVCVNCGKKA